MSTTATRPGVTDLGRRASALAVRCRDNPDDQEAWGELIRAIGRFVGQRAAGLVRPCPRYDEDDLRQEGWLGVVRAVRDFDPDRAELTTRADPWIKQRMRRGRDEVAYPAHVPRDVLDRARRWRDAGRPADAEMERTHAAMVEVSGRPGRDRDGVMSLDAFLPTAERDDPAEVAARRDEVARLEWAVERLRRDLPRHAEMLCRYHGLFGRERAIHREIGAEFGVTRSRAAQIIEDATDRVAEMLGAGRDGEAA